MRSSCRMKRHHNMSHAMHYSKYTETHGYYVKNVRTKEDKKSTLQNYNKHGIIIYNK